MQVTTDVLRRYVNELALLRSAFHLGYGATPPKVFRVPSFPMLQEDNTRDGFLQDAEYDKLAGAANKVGLWMRGLLAVYNTYGWRRSEPLNELRVRQVDLVQGTVDLNPGATKNKGCASHQDDAGSSRNHLDVHCREESGRSGLHT